MSDLLGSLIARARGEAQVLRPALGPSFGPPARFGAIGDDPDAREVLPAAVAPEEPRPLPAPGAPVRPHARGPIRPAAASPDAPREQGTPRPAAEPDASAADTRRARAVRRADPALATTTPDRIPDPDVEPPPPSRVVPRATKRAQPTPPVAAPAPAQVPISAEPRAGAVSATRQERPVRARSGRDPAPEAARSRADRAPENIPRASRPMTLRPDLPEPDEEAIRITIGRIEVRQPAPPAPPAPPAEPQMPRLSLEEFLSDGGRRHR